MDLACLGIEITAPIAKKAYWKQYQLRERGPGCFGQCMGLIEVEDKAVGRKLLSSLRSGRIGLIYVDGNMGPNDEGNTEHEDQVTVKFFNKNIRVKAGITRLSHAFKYPILPLFTKQVNGQQTIEPGELIHPLNADKSDKTKWQQATMQTLYTALEHQVTDDPSQWEYALCLHRWLTKSENTGENSTLEEKTVPLLSPEDSIKVNRKSVSVMNLNDQIYWVDVNREKVIASPNLTPNLFKLLDEQPGIKVSKLLHYFSGKSNQDLAINILNELNKKSLIEIF